MLNCNFKPVVEPSSYVLTCADDGTGLTDVHWTSWTSHLASAYGTFYENTCTPNCAEGKINHYRALVTLRHADPVVTEGAFELLLPEHLAIWAFLRRGHDAELLVAANFSGEPVTAVLPVEGGWADAEVVLASQSLANRPPSGSAMLRRYLLWVGGSTGRP